MTTLPAAVLEEIFTRHKPFLWGLCYRLTGSAADADDLVQETFTRVLERPPARTDEPWRPWLVRVALNLGKDLLRRRKRRAYLGPWLPSPIRTEGDGSLLAHEPVFAEEATAESRYDLLESVSFAFLLALEALTPRQRAVLLLRDVFDYSVQETADALSLSEPNVKTTHHRARRAMHAYDRARIIPTRTLQEQTRRALERFMTCLLSHDVAGLESLLAADVRIVSDGGGEFHAALKPIIGRDKVMRFYLKTSARNRPIARQTIQLLNGLPTLIVTFADDRAHEARQFVHQCILDANERITTCYTVLASRKLTHLSFSSLP